MNTRNRMLTVLCLICGLAQAPAANAQAELLVAVGAKLLPVVIPMALSTIPMIPVLIKQYAPPIRLPRLGRKKDAANNDQNTTTDDTAEGNTESGSETKTDGSAKAEKPPAKETEEEAPQPEVAVRRQPRDSSEWYMEDDAVPAQTQSTSGVLHEAVKQRIAAKKSDGQATESVKAELLTAPQSVDAPQPAQAKSAATVAAPVLYSDAPAPVQPTPPAVQPSAPPPHIMMNVAD